MSMRPRQTRVPVGPLVAAVGAVVLIVSLFLDWYDSLSGFTVFEFLDLLLVLLALATIASLAGGLGVLRPAPSPTISLAVAVFTVYVVASQVIHDPPLGIGREREIGIWLALAGALLMVVGAVLGYARISLAVERRSERSRSEPVSVGTPDSPEKPKPEPGRPVAGADDPPERP
jgi:hypothetical protein